MAEARRYSPGIQESMKSPSMGFDISAGTGGPDRRMDSSLISRLLSSVDDDLKTATTSSEKEAARAGKRSAIRLVLETPAKDLPSDVKRYVVGPRGPDGKLLLANSQYSQYQIIITFHKEGRTIPFDASRDMLISPTATTLEERDADRIEIDRLVRTNAQLIKEEPIDIYNRNLAEMESLRQRDRLIRAEEEQAGMREPGVITYDERAVIPLLSALTRANEIDFVPEPEIALIKDRRRGGTNAEISMRIGYPIGTNSWLQIQRPRRFKFSTIPNRLRFPLERLEEMSAAYEAGDTSRINSAGHTVLQFINAASTGTP